MCGGPACQGSMCGEFILREEVILMESGPQDRTGKEKKISTDQIHASKIKKNR
jgi:hypothetical protein